MPRLRSASVRRIGLAAARRSATIVALVALLSSLSCAGPPSACAPVSGGEQASVVQLRHVSFGDDQVSLLFVQRPGEAYGIPSFAVGVEHGVIRLRLTGARLRNPDGTPSYDGPRTFQSAEGRMKDVRIDEDRDGAVVVEIPIDGRGCPRVASRRSGLGSTFSAAFVSVALRDGPVVALDPDSGRPGGPMQVVGMGFAPSSPVIFHSGGRTVWVSRSDARGWLDTVLFVPDLPPGEHVVLVRDAAGAALARYRVD